MTLHTVLGPIRPDQVGAVLPAETPLRSQPAPIRTHDAPATRVEFARAPVHMGALGQLSLGWDNDDDRTLELDDAVQGLKRWASDEGEPLPLIVCLDGAHTEARMSVYAELAARARVHVLRAVGGTLIAELTTEQPAPDPKTLRERLHNLIAEGGGAVGALPVHTAPELLAVCAAVAAETGLALVLSCDARTRDRDVERALTATTQAGLPRERIMLTGAQHLIAADVGVVPNAAARLQELGVALCFDDLGRIPTVRTVVSDHDISQVCLELNRLGAGSRVLLSVGIANKHRLTAFGGNGYEFISTQLLPYLRMFGAEDDFIAQLARDNALTLFRQGERNQA